MANEVANLSDTWEGGRETPDLFRSVQESFNTGQYATDYDCTGRKDGQFSETIQPEDLSLSSVETVDVVRDALDNARQGMQQSLLGSEKVGEAVKLKLTIDLGRRRIEFLPDEVIQILKKDVERLVLSNNQICSLPYRFSECTALTYLNLRGNRFKEFPNSIYNLPKLQILDLSRNRLKRIPEDIKFMKALRVLSVMNNDLEQIPHSIGFLDSLKILKVSGNPFKDGLKGVLDGHDASPSVFTPIAENEKDAHMTAKIKHYLKAELHSLESEDESSSESPLETPRPLKRNTSLRFPVVPALSGSESAPDSKSPGLFKPVIPTRSHYRMASGQNAGLQSATLRRPGLAPLLIGNERNRSNSESVLHATQVTKSKRMGIVSRKHSDISALEEARSNRNSFHYRGLSHGSGLRDRQSGLRNGINSVSSNPSSPHEDHQEGMFVRRLSSLPEQKGEPKPAHKLIEGAKGVLYSLHLVHPLLGQLLSVLRDGSSKRSSLERVYYNASTHLEKLDQELHVYDNIGSDEEKQKQRTIRNVSSACRASLKAYRQVGVLLVSNGPRLVDNGDERYIRTLLLVIHGGAVEGRNALSTINAQVDDLKTSSIEKPFTSAMQKKLPTLTIRSETPPQDMTLPGRRQRGEPLNSANGSMRPPLRPKPENIRQSSVPLYINGRSRSNSRSNTLTTSTSSSVANTPRSGESFLIPSTPLTVMSTNHSASSSGIDPNQDIVFEKMYLGLSESVDHGLSAVPIAKSHFKHRLDIIRTKYVARDTINAYVHLIDRCQHCESACEILKNCLSTIKLNDPEVRNSAEFWRLFTNFANAYFNLVRDIKGSKKVDLATSDISRILKPLHASIKLTQRNVQESPWSWALHENSPLQQTSSQTHWHANNHLTSQINTRLYGYSRSRDDSVSSNLASPYMPATPLSAALGVAAQATVPTTPSSSTSLDRSFQGDVFQRADALLSQQQTMLHRR